MAKAKRGIFTVSVISASQNEMNKDILSANVGDKEMKKELNRVFQKANRRLQNLKNANLASTALSDLMTQRDINKYSVFSISGLDINKPSDWEIAKNEYGKALSFLNRPTSTASGARQYIRHYAKEYKVSFETMNEQMQYKINDMIMNGFENQIQSSAMLRELYGDVEREGKESELDSETFAKQLENQLNEQLRNTTIFDILKNL